MGTVIWTEMSGNLDSLTLETNSVHGLALSCCARTCPKEWWQAFQKYFIYISVNL